MTRPPRRTPRRKEPVKVTLAEILAALSTLSVAQLNEPAVWWGEERGGFIGAVRILGEDFVDMGADGCEPISAYLAEAENDKERSEIRENIVHKKGALIFEVDLERDV